MPFEEWLDIAAELPVDGVETYWGITPETTAERQAQREAAAARGLSIPMLCYSPDFTHPDRSERAAEVDHQIEAIEAIADLGGRYCRVLSGQRRPGVSAEEGLEWAAECIRSCLPAAEGRDVVLILENHYKDDFWEYPELAQSREHFLALLERIPEHPHFGVNFDPSNALLAGDDPIALLDAVKERVVTMHASDRWVEGGDDALEELQHRGTGYADVLEHGVVGEGMIDYPAVFRRLREVDFDGWISIEDGTDPEVGLDDLRASATYLRGLMNEHGIT